MFCAALHTHEKTRGIACHAGMYSSKTEITGISYRIEQDLIIPDPYYQQFRQIISIHNRNLISGK
jgi:hypothetical protein